MGTQSEIQGNMTLLKIAKTTRQDKVIGERRIRDFHRYGKGNLKTATLFERKNTRSILSTYKARNFPSKLTESVETGFPSSLLYPILDQSLMFQTTVTALLPVQ